jgi:hypothetical protein
LILLTAVHDARYLGDTLIDGLERVVYDPHFPAIHTASSVTKGPPAATIAARLVFSGRGLGAGFLEFVADRAAKLSLDGSGSLTGPTTEATVLVSGSPALVDMLEVAYLLGPADCLVEDVSSERVEDVRIESGFHLGPPGDRA